MTIDEAGIRKAILLLNAHNMTYAGHVWDLLDAYRVAVTRLEAATAPKKPTLREQLRDPHSGVVNIGRPRNALAGSRPIADPNLGQIAGMRPGDTTVYVLLEGDEKTYHRLFGAQKNCGRIVGNHVGSARPVPHAHAASIQAAPCLKCWDWSEITAPGWDDMGTVWLTGDTYHRASSYVQDRQRRVCLLGVTQMERATGEDARVSGAKPCPECYRNWPGTDGPDDCFNCLTGPCPAHNCEACQGSGDDPSGTARCETCKGSGTRPARATGCDDVQRAAPGLDPEDCHRCVSELPCLAHPGLTTESPDLRS